MWWPWEKPTRHSANNSGNATIKKRKYENCSYTTAGRRPPVNQSFAGYQLPPAKVPNINASYVSPTSSAPHVQHLRGTSFNYQGVNNSTAQSGRYHLPENNQARRYDLKPNLLAARSVVPVPHYAPSQESSTSNLPSSQQNCSTTSQEYHIMNSVVESQPTPINDQQLSTPIKDSGAIPVGETITIGGEEQSPNKAMQYPNHPVFMGNNNYQIVAEHQRESTSNNAQNNQFLTAPITTIVVQSENSQIAASNMTSCQFPVSNAQIAQPGD